MPRCPSRKHLDAIETHAHRRHLAKPLTDAMQIEAPFDVAGFQPAVSPISNRQSRLQFRALWRRRSVCGLETRDTADLEICATARRHHAEQVPTRSLSHCAVSARIQGHNSPPNFGGIRSMNPAESPSTALRAPSPPLGEKDGMRGFGSWIGGTSKIWARIGAMNQIGTPLPALSPQGGERVAEGRERGSSWKRKWVRWK